jgi:hypothetical protein
MRENILQGTKTSFFVNELIPKIYTIGRVTQWNAILFFLLKNFPLYGRSIGGGFVVQK